jgi:hypothetical protein
MELPQNGWFTMVHNGKSQSNMDDNWGYPLVNKQFAIENGPVEIVDLPII